MRRLKCKRQRMRERSKCSQLKDCCLAITYTAERIFIVTAITYVGRKK